jgi:hypothetical protein
MGRPGREDTRLAMYIRTVDLVLRAGGRVQVHRGTVVANKDLLRQA